MRAAVLLTAVAASLALAAPAHAVPQWLAPVGVAGPLTDSVGGDVAVAPDGTTLAISQQTVAGFNRIRARLRRPGGEFGPTIELSPADKQAAAPSVAVDQAGNFTAVWTLDDPTTQVKAARLAAGASAFEPTETVGPIDTFVAPVLAVGGNGTAVIALREGSVVKAALRTGADGEFGPVSAPLSGTLAIADTFAAAVDDAGSAIVVWSRDDSGAGKTFVEASERPAGGSFLPSRQLSKNDLAGDKATGPVIAMAPNGRAIVLWTFDTNADQPHVQDIERKPDGSWMSAPELASREVDQASGPHVAMAGDGTAVAVWGVDVATFFLPQVAVRRPDQTFEIERNLSSAPFGALDIAVNRTGTTTVAWSGSMSENISAVRRPPGGTFGNVDTVAIGTQGTADPAIAVNVQSLGTDDQSNATLLYTRDVVGTGVNSHSLLAASYDAAAPTLDAVSVPGGGNPGAAIGMAATASDRLSSPAITWSFGDGVNASGPAVSHAYGAPGAYTVTVTATDAAGNAASESHPVLITAVGGPPPPPRIDSPVLVTWGVQKKRIFLLRLKVTKTPKGAKVQLRCKGKKCPFKRRSSTKRRKGAITLYKEIKARKVVGKRLRSFRAGQRLQLRITAAGLIGKVVKYRLKKGKIPSGRQFCLSLGANKPQRTC